MKTRFTINEFDIITNLIFWMLTGYLSGDSGMGFFATSYLLFSFIFTIMMESIGSVVAKMVSVRNYRGLHDNAKKVFRYGLMYSVFMGLAVCAIIMFAGDTLFQLIYKTTLPSSTMQLFGVYFFLKAITSCFCGYYQGMGNLITTKLILLIKDIILVAGSPFIIPYFYRYGEKIGALLQNKLCASAYGAMGAVTLLCICEAISIIVYLAFLKKTIRGQILLGNKISVKGIDSSKSFFTNFINLSFKILKNNLFPITFAFLITVLYINISLKNGANANQIFNQIGITFDKLLIVCFLPVALFKEFVGKEKLRLHNDYVKEETKNVKIRAQYLVKNSLFILLPITVMVLTLAKPIVMIFFGGHMKMGVMALRCGGILILLAGMTMSLKAILISIGKDTTVLLSSLTSMLASMIFAVVTFKTNQSIEVYILTFVLYYTVNLLLTFSFVFRQLRISLFEFRAKLIVMMIATVIVAVLELVLDYLLVMNVLWLLFSIILGYVVYYAIHFLLRAISKRDETSLKESFCYIPIHYAQVFFHLWE